jgi:hypothetical protein
VVVLEEPTVFLTEYLETLGFAVVEGNQRPAVGPVQHLGELCLTVSGGYLVLGGNLHLVKEQVVARLFQGQWFQKGLDMLVPAGREVSMRVLEDLVLLGSEVEPHHHQHREGSDIELGNNPVRQIRDHTQLHNNRTTSNRRK